MTPTGHIGLPDVGELAALVLQARQKLPAALLLVAALAVGVALLYGPQVRPLRWRWKLLLCGLRLLGLSTLALAMLRPVFPRDRDASERKSIVIMIDRSRSMALRDAHRSPPQLVTLAAGLRMLPSGTRAASSNVLTDEVTEIQRLIGESHRQLDELAQARGDYEFALLPGHDAALAQQRLEEAMAAFVASARDLAAHAVSPRIRNTALARPLAQLGHEIDQSANSTRDEEWIGGMQQRLDAVSDAAGTFLAEADLALYRNNPKVRKVCDDLAAMNRLQLTQAALVDPTSGVLGQLDPSIPLFGYSFAGDIRPLGLRAGRAAVKRLLLDPDGQTTDIAGSLRDVLERLRQAPVAAVAIFSDGRSIDADRAAQRQVIDAGVPIYTVAVAGPGLWQDPWFASVQTPDAIYDTEPAKVLATVRWPFRRGSVLNVTLDCDGAHLSERLTIGAGDIATAAFEPRLAGGGAHRLIIGLSSERNGGSTAAMPPPVERWVKVIAGRLRALGISTAPSNDYIDLARMLRTAPWARFREAGGESFAAQDLTTTDIEQSDLLVLDDLAPAALDGKQWDAVRRAVRDRGAALIMLAGRGGCPDAYAPALGDLLPFTGQPRWKRWRGDDAVYHLAPPSLPDAAAHQRWDELPALFDYCTGPLKSDATALLSERDSGAGVLIRQRQGRGCVLFAGADELWRWRLGIGSAGVGAMWEGCVRDAARQPYAVETQGLRMDLDRVDVEPGQTVRLRCERPNSASGASPAPRAQLLRDGAAAQALDLRGIEGETGRFDARIQGLSAGDYVVRVEAPAAGAGEARTAGGGRMDSGARFSTQPATAAAVQCALHVGPRYDVELSEPSGDRRELARLAELSGGAAFSLESLGGLSDALNAAVRRGPQKVQAPLWQSVYFYFFVLACFAAEWAVRKQLGLA